jgi:hypothetical protein
MSRPTLSRGWCTSSVKTAPSARANAEEAAAGGSHPPGGRGRFGQPPAEVVGSSYERPLAGSASSGWTFMAILSKSPLFLQRAASFLSPQSIRDTNSSPRPLTSIRNWSIAPVCYFSTGTISARYTFRNSPIFSGCILR